jgi:hypothetical protein
MLVFRFQERYILHFFAPKKRRNPYSDYLVLVLQQTLINASRSEQLAIKQVLNNLLTRIE